MAFRKKPQSPEPTKPLDLDDFFHVAVEGDLRIVRPEPILTGLSDEEDAQRYLALRFNPALGFCRNCEGTFDRATNGSYCHRCNELLADPGSPPYRRKSR